MKKEIKLVDEKRGIVQTTTIDERWYSKEGTDAKTGLPTIEWRPSASWIAAKYPAGIGLLKWYAENGWDEAEAIKNERAESGSKVHQACRLIAEGKDVAIDDVFQNPNTGMLEALDVDEYEKVMQFKDWLGTLTNPKVLATELIVWTDRYAGTLDLLIEEGEKDKRETSLVDIKTSKSIYDSTRIQINLYFAAGPFEIDGGRIAATQQKVLQLGYKLNQRGWKETLIPVDMTKAEIAYEIWKLECGEDKPLQRDLPLVIEGLKPTTSVQEKPKVEQNTAKPKGRAK